MNAFMILAETAANKSSSGQIVPIDWVWEQINALTWLQALIALSFGAVYLLYGWRIFKVLAVVSFAMLGLFGGIKIGETLGSTLWGGIVGLVLLGAVSIPLMRWAVSVLGAVAGGIITSGIWYACELPEQYIWAGTVIGIIAGGMISFIVFKISVMLFTSLGGGILIVIAMLSLLQQYEQNLADPTNYVSSLVNDHQWFLPVALMLITAVGMIVQNKLVKGYSEWEL